MPLYRLSLKNSQAGSVLLCNTTSPLDVVTGATDNQTTSNCDARCGKLEIAQIYCILTVE